MDNEDSSESNKQSLLISSKNSIGGFDILKALEGVDSEYELKKIKPNLYRLTIDKPELIKENFKGFTTRLD
jgi:hypothetical protein